LLLVAALLAAQQPGIENASLQALPLGGELGREFSALVGRLQGPAWVGYSVPRVAGRARGCCSGSRDCCRCSLEGSGADHSFSGDSARRVELESPDSLLVLFRVDARRLEKVRTFSEDCRLDAGGLPFYWLENVQPAESVSLLSSLVIAEGAPHNKHSVGSSALAAIALHADPAADSQLQEFAQASQPEWLREETAFWLGAARGQQDHDLLRRMLREDRSVEVREKVVFALSISSAPQAINTLIQTARSDSDPHVRGQALFWLAQKAGKKAAAAITEAVEADPELRVKERAVFALSQLPPQEGVPLLIRVARTNRSRQVRKKAVFWLGQSGDPRALAFLEEVLTR
jgi:HEAT repeat protein